MEVGAQGRRIVHGKTDVYGALLIGKYGRRGKKTWEIFLIFWGWGHSGELR